MSDTQNTSLIKPLLSQTWSIFKAHWSALCAIVLLAYLPMNIFIEWYNVAHGMNRIEDLIPVYRFAGIYELLLGSFAYILIVLLVVASLKNENATFAQTWKNFTGTVYIRMIWTRVIGGILTGLLFLLLIVPGIIFSVFWIFSDVLVVLEGQGGWQALKASKKMVEGRWWKILWVAFVGFVSTVVLFNVLSFGLGYLGDNWGIGIISSFITDLGSASFVVYITLAYLKIKTSSDKSALAI